MRHCAVLLIAFPLMLISSFGQHAPTSAVERAVSTDAAVATRARDELRARGPDGLADLMSTYSGAIQDHLQGKAVENWPHIAAAIDAVARQRDAWASGLFWFTDLQQARDASKTTGKPILSLRLLGSLDSELSCANSRFFRTTLYPAPAVSKRMRENFVLHWSSERPVPVVTVDFGDGRVLKRTVTGNSAHYMLAANGQPIDVLPGLYNANTFANWLDEMSQLAAQLRAAGDSASEQRLVRELHARKREANTSPKTGAKLDPVAVAVIRAKRPNAVAAGRLALSKCAVEDPLAKTLVALQSSIDQDTITNESTLHSKIHDWFADGAAPNDFEALNRRVYAELFLTPRSDPWLGLAPEDAWSALDGDGLDGGNSSLAALQAR